MNPSKIDLHLPPVVVCISDHPGMDMLLRTAVAEAGTTGRTLYALYVETPLAAQTMSPRNAERLLRTLTQAEQLGASIAKTEARTVLAGILGFIRDQEPAAAGVPLLVMGQTVREGLLSGLHTSLAARVADALGADADLRTVPLPRFSRPVLLRMGRGLDWGCRGWNILAGLAATILTLVIGEGFLLLLPDGQMALTASNMSILFLVACVFITGRYGLLPGMLTATGGFVMVRSLHTPPTPSSPPDRGTSPPCCCF